MKHRRGGRSYVEQVEATTLRGLLRESLTSDPDLAQTLFDAIVGRDTECFSWDVRGPRLFRQMVGEWRELNGRKADVIALQEYDVHNALADYRGTGIEEPFVEAMASAGYSRAFFKGPKRRFSGLAIYWRVSTCAAQGEASPITVELSCGESALVDGAFDIDLDEHYHSVAKAGERVRVPGGSKERGADPAAPPRYRRAPWSARRI